MANPLIDVIAQIKQRISDNPKIHDSSHVGISDQKKGFLMWQTRQLQILGRVNTQEEFDAINAIVAEEADGFEVINTLRVQYRS